MLETIFQNPTQKVLSTYKPLVNQINSLENTLISFTDSELREKTEDLKSRLLNGESKNSLIPEAFALVREATRRVLGLRHFDVHVIHLINLADIRNPARVTEALLLLRTRKGCWF